MNTRVLTAALVAAIALAGCGGAGGDSADPTEAATEQATQAAAPTKDEWIDQALVECEAVNTALDENEPEGDPFSPQASDADREQGVTYLTSAANSLGSFSQNLRDLGFPEEDPDGAEAIVDAAEDSSQAFAEAASTAEEDFASAQPAVEQAFESFGPLEEAAAAYGIGDLEECRREGEEPQQVNEGFNEVAVTAVGEDGSYDFEFEQPVAAGDTAFVLDNADDEAHFMFVARITGDLSLDEILEAEQEGEDIEQYAEEVGGSDDAEPGEQAVLNVGDLKPGTYGMLCYIPAPDGTPHAYKGMAVEFEVE